MGFGTVGSPKSGFGVFGAGNSQGGGGVTPEPIGEIFTDTFDRLSLGSNYTLVGSPTVVMDGNNLVLSGGAGTYAKYVKYNAWTTCLENWQIVINFQIVDKTASSFGIAVGIKTASAFGNRSVLAQFNHTTGVNGGKTFIVAGTSAPDTFAAPLATSAAQVISAGDEMRMTINRVGLEITVLTQNLTTGTSTTLSYTFSLASGQTVYQHNTGNPYIVSLGGTQSIHDWTYSSVSQKNINSLFEGNSITHGLSALIRLNTFVNLINSSSYERNAGGGDYTLSAIQKINEIILQNPKYAIIMLGGNDLQFGIASGTWQANYASNVSQLKAAGITVIHCYATPRDSTDVTPLNTWISSTYGGIDTVIDTFTPLKGSGTDLAAAYDSGDGVHPNAAGHALIAATILAAAPQIQ